MMIYEIFVDMEIFSCHVRLLKRFYVVLTTSDAAEAAKEATLTHIFSGSSGRQPQTEIRDASDVGIKYPMLNVYIAMEHNHHVEQYLN